MKNYAYDFLLRSYFLRYFKHFLVSVEVGTEIAKNFLILSENFMKEKQQAKTVENTGAIFVP